MPFGRDELDELFKKQISPTLRSLNLDIVRVDRREHKEDLNVYINKMIQNSDMALADLTFARPSVYYEAGFAERQIPVIYTVRKDHLDKGQRDDNLRVHFDLGMKKIITWRDPDDTIFSGALKRRASYFARPLKLRLIKDLVLEKDKNEFLSMSIQERIDKLSRAFRTMLTKSHFQLRSIKDFHYKTFLASPGNILIGVKLVGHTSFLVTVIMTDALSRRIISDTIAKMNSETLIASHKWIKDYRELVIFASLSKFADSRLASALPDAQKLPDAGPFILKKDFRHSGKYRAISIVLLDSINSRHGINGAVNKCTSFLPKRSSLNTPYVVSHKHFFRTIRTIRFKGLSAPYPKEQLLKLLNSTLKKTIG